MNEDEKWYRSRRNFKLKRPNLEHWALQNKPKFIKIGSQEAEIALSVEKFLLCHIIYYLKIYYLRDIMQLAQIKMISLHIIHITRNEQDTFKKVFKKL